MGIDVVVSFHCCIVLHCVTNLSSIHFYSLLLQVMGVTSGFELSAVVLLGSVVFIAFGELKHTFLLGMYLGIELVGSKIFIVFFT